MRPIDKCVKYRFSVVPGDVTALFGMPDTGLLGIMRIMCKAIGNKINGKMFDSQSKHVVGC